MTAAHQPWHTSNWFRIWERLARHTALLLACVWSVSGASYYVATNGSATNSGAIGAPWSIQYALTNATVAAGDTVYLRGGTYTGFFQSTLTGSSGNRITVQNYNGERAIIQATNNDATVLTLNGAWTDYSGLEVCNSYTDRTAVRANGIDVFGSDVRIINCVVHDNGNGIGTWATATNNVISGCVIYNNGYQGVDRGHGHGIYAQNIGGGGRIKTIENNIILNQYGLGIQCYGSSEAFVNDFLIDGNFTFNNGSLATVPGADELLVAGGTGVVGATVRSNVLWKTFTTSATVTFGDLFTTNTGLSFTANKVRQMVYWQNWDDIAASGNTIYRAPSQNVLKLQSYNPSVPVGYTFGSNAYWSSAGDGFQAALNGSADGTNYTFAQWQTLTGLDGTSANSTSAPSGSVIVVRPNTYETGRANVAVINWDGSSSVTANISSIGLSDSQPYEVRDSQNYNGTPVVRSVYRSASPTVSLPMNLTAVSPVVGGTTPSHTPVTFNAFVILPTSSVPITKTRGFFRKR